MFRLHIWSGIFWAFRVQEVKTDISLCTEPLKIGPCKALFPRFFYNVTSCQCESFGWGGCEPNGNNFLTKDECISTCKTPMITNPICTEPKTPGLCRGYFPRWWYNSTSCKCEEFVYGGCGGNDNNFLTKESCQANCGCHQCEICNQPIQPQGPGLISCLAYIPSWGYNATSCKCESFIYSGCGGNANRFSTQEECAAQCGNTPCEKSVGPNCILPKDAGPCEALIERFYYDPLNCKCKKFNYGGCMGNNNNFLTRRKCKRACKDTKCPVCNLPKDPGPCRGSFKRFFFNIQTCQCESFIYGGCGGNENNYESLEDCQAVCGSIQCPVCSLPKAKGRCTGSLDRWYFDATECTCKPFTYSGCGGNMNRFLTKEDCMGSCGSYPCPVCLEPMKVGPCRAAINRWYYNSLANECQQFSWGGCQPNGNNFMTKSQCNQVCKKFVCSLPSERGPCDAVVPRYYYDSITKQCLLFKWGGCESNGNNFETLEACISSCA